MRKTASAPSSAAASKKLHGEPATRSQRGLSACANTGRVLASNLCMKTNPYEHAPRLPEGEQIDPRLLVGAFAAPIEIEIGPGRGGFVFERLAADPEVF